MRLWVLMCDCLWEARWERKGRGRKKRRREGRGGGREGEKGGEGKRRRKVGGTREGRNVDYLLDQWFCEVEGDSVSMEHSKGYQHSHPLQQFHMVLQYSSRGESLAILGEHHTRLQAEVTLHITPSSHNTSHHHYIIDYITITQLLHNHYIATHIIVMHYQLLPGCAQLAPSFGDDIKSSVTYGKPPFVYFLVNLRC